MIKAVRQKKRRKRRVYFAGLLIVLLAVAGSLFCLSLSLQDISRIIHFAAAKVPENQALAGSRAPIVRGTIYDRTFKELSVSYRLFTLYVHPAELSDRIETAGKLALILGRDKESLAGQLKNVQRVIVVSDDLDEQQASDVRALALDGVYCTSAEERYYPAHKIAGHLLGFTSNGVGLAGIEGLYDPVLQPGEFRNSDVPEVDFSDAEALGKTPDVDMQQKDPLFEDAARLMVQTQQGSTSSIQRKFSIGYNRSGRIIDQLEASGVVGPYEGSKARKVLYPDEYSLEQFLKTLDL